MKLEGAIYEAGQVFYVFAIYLCKQKSNMFNTHSYVPNDTGNPFVIPAYATDRHGTNYIRKYLNKTQVLWNFANYIQVQVLQP